MPEPLPEVSMLSILLATALSHAASPAEVLGSLEASTTEAPPAMALSCAPLGSLVSLLGSMPLPPMALAQAASNPRASFWLGMLDPAQAKASGLDLTGALTLSFWEDEAMRVMLPFTGDVVAADALLATLGELGRTEVAGQWTLEIKDASLEVSQLPDRLILRKGTPSSSGSAGGSSLLDGLPDVPGCAFYLDMDAAPGKGRLAGARVAALLPLEGGAPLTVRLRLPEVPAILERSLSAPIGGSSVEAPSVVLSIGVAPMDLLRALGDLSKKPLDLPEFDETRLVIEPGVTVVTFGKPQDLDFAAVVGVRSGSGKAYPPARLAKAARKGLKKKGSVVEKIDRTRFAVQLDDKVLYTSFGDGRVGVGTNQTAVNEAIAGQGAPWVDGRFAAYALEWPVAFAGGPGAQTLGNVDLRGGLRTRAGVYELALEIKDGGDGTIRGAMAAGLGMAAAMAVPNFMEMQKKAKRAEAGNQVDRIYEAQLARADQGYLALPVAPRDPGALNGERVSFQPLGPWAELLGAEDAGDLRGTYWVDLSADGSAFIVHGLIDSDGDGIPAHFRRSLGGETEQLTPDEVY